MRFAPPATPGVGISSPFHHQAPPYDTIHHSVNPLLPVLQERERGAPTRGGAVSMWFGRSRVQDRAADSDERGVTDDASTRPSPTRPNDSGPDPDVASEHSGWVDDNVLSTAGAD